MFTGIIESLGTIEVIDHPAQHTQRLKVRCGFSEIVLGESIAINGVCLTAVAAGDDTVAFEVSPETLACTSLGALRINDTVNLERAMLPTTRFGGHIVSGHVDALATVESIAEDGDFYTVCFGLDKALLRYIVKKGSVAVDGCSLTVNTVSDSGFSVMIIPHTWNHTVFHRYKQGGKVNIEVDMIARYVERLLFQGRSTDSTAMEEGILLAAQHTSGEHNV